MLRQVCASLLLLSPAVLGSAIFEEPEIKRVPIVQQQEVEPTHEQVAFIDPKHQRVLEIDPEQEVVPALPTPEATATPSKEEPKEEKQKQECRVSDLSYSELAATFVWPAVANAHNALVRVLNEDAAPASANLAEVQDAASDAIALLALLHQAYPIAKAEEADDDEPEVFIRVLHALMKSNRAVGELLSAGMSLSPRQAEIERLRTMVTMKNTASLLKSDFVHDYLVTPSTDGFTSRPAESLPGHFWGSFVPQSLPSNDYTGIGNMARLLDVYVNEAGKEWSSATGKDAPELRELDDVFTRLTYRLDAAQSVARLFPCVWKDREQGTDIFGQVAEFRDKEAQIARGLQLYQIYVENKELAQAQELYEEVSGEWQELQEWQTSLAPEAAFNSLPARVHANLAVSTPAAPVSTSHSSTWKYVWIGLCLLVAIPAVVVGLMYARNAWINKSQYQPIES